MARSHAIIKTSIWDDGDFLALSALAQRLYFVITSQRKTSIVGCVDYMPHRWARYAPDTTVADIEDAARVLHEQRFVLIDYDTAEVLVRTMVRHDGVRLTANRNLLKGLWASWEAIESPWLRQVVIDHVPDDVWNADKCPPPAAALEMRHTPPTGPPDRTAGRNRRTEPPVVTAGSNGRIEPPDLSPTSGQEISRSEGIEPPVQTAGPNRRSEPTRAYAHARALPPSTFLLSSSPRSEPAVGTGGSTDPGTEEEELAGQVAAIVGLADHEHRLASMPGAPIQYPERHLAQCIERRRADPALTAFVRHHPGQDAEQIATQFEHVLGRSPQPHPSQRPEIHCERCDGAGVVEIEPDVFTQCDHRPPDTPPAPTQDQPVDLATVRQFRQARAAREREAAERAATDTRP